VLAEVDEPGAVSAYLSHRVGSDVGLIQRVTKTCTQPDRVVEFSQPVTRMCRAIEYTGPVLAEPGGAEAAAQGQARPPIACLRSPGSW
jgi:hypothetical protein